MIEEEPGIRTEFIETNDSLTVKVAPNSPLAIIFAVAVVPAIFMTVSFWLDSNWIGVTFFGLNSVLSLLAVLWVFGGRHVLSINREYVQIRQQIFGIPFYSRRFPVDLVTGFCHGIRLGWRRMGVVPRHSVLEIMIKDRVVEFGKEDFDFEQVRFILSKLARFATTQKAQWSVTEPPVS